MAANAFVCPIPLLASLVSASGCVAAALPPARAEIATGVAERDGQAITVARASAGAHLASITDGPVDVGVGIQGEVPTTREEAVGPMPRRTTPEAAASPLLLAGPYVELSHRIFQRGHRRAWLGGRAVMLWPGGDPSREGGAIGAVARVDFEVFTHVRGAGGGGGSRAFVAGALVGKFGLGLFAESGARLDDDRDLSFTATAGVTLRIPAFAVLAFGCP